MSSSPTDAPPRSSTSRCPRWACRWPRARSSAGASRWATGSTPTTRSATSRPTRSTPRCRRRSTGVVAEILVPVDETVAVGTVLARIASVDGAAGRRPDGAARRRPADEPRRVRGPRGRAAADTGAARSPNRASARGDRRRYSPVVQRIAVRARHRPVAGAGHRARRSRAQAGRARVHRVGAVGPAAPEPPLHIESPYRPEPVPAGRSATSLSRMRRQIGEHMKRSLDTAAHCTTWIEVDMSRVEAARARLGVTALAFVARASSTRCASTRL